MNGYGKVIDFNLSDSDTEVKLNSNIYPVVVGENMNQEFMDEKGYVSSEGLWCLVPEENMNVDGIIPNNTSQIIPSVVEEYKKEDTIFVDKNLGRHSITKTQSEIRGLTRENIVKEQGRTR